MTQATVGPHPYQNAFWIACAAVALGLLDMPYGYYTVLRLVMAAVALYSIFHLPGSGRGMTWVLGALAVLYNPVFPVNIGEKELWVLINVATLVIFWKIGRELRPSTTKAGFPFERRPGPTRGEPNEEAYVSQPSALPSLDSGGDRGPSVEESEASVHESEKTENLWFLAFVGLIISFGLFVLLAKISS